MRVAPAAPENPRQDEAQVAQGRQGDALPPERACRGHRANPVQLESYRLRESDETCNPITPILI